MRGLPKCADSTAVRIQWFCLVAGLFLGLTNDRRAADGGYIAIEKRGGCDGDRTSESIFTSKPGKVVELWPAMMS